MLPAASPEQQRAIDLFCDGRDLVVQAVAGAGKTSLLLLACANLPRDEEVLVVAYNKCLADEFNTLAQAAGLENVKAYTFHGLASSVYELCRDDTSMHEIVTEAEQRGARPRRLLTPTHLLVDEVQDCRDLYWRLLGLVVDLPATHTLLVGDREQVGGIL